MSKSARLSSARLLFSVRSSTSAAASTPPPSYPSSPFSFFFSGQKRFFSAGVARGER
ncbi:unnamed protein product [Rhodiola kirilowii]